MCGLAGIVAWNGHQPIDAPLLERMRKRIAHRGPDGQGIYLSPTHQERARAGLVHCRLAILDLDQRSNQPFTDGTGRHLVFNGEIYNYRALRAELSALVPDYPWRTNGDTEVLLRAYAQWGHDCCNRLEGMFAFAVWDETDASLFLARDRMGQKPLYVHGLSAGGQPPKTVAFASELGAIKVLPGFDAALDRAALSTYLMLGYIPQGTIYQSTTKLPAGHWARITARSSTIERYWHPTAAAPFSDQQSITTTRTLVHQAVQRQLVSDVPVGCFLSGGIDSSIVAAAMVKALGDAQRVTTFTIGFADKRYDETAHAAAVAKHLGTEHRQFIVRPDAAADLPRLAHSFGEPFGDSSALATHYLARETRNHVKVALSGDGGDELFGGYDRYRAMAIAQQLARLPDPARRLIRQAIQLMPGSHPKGLTTRFKRLISGLDQSPADRYLGYVSLFDSTSLGNLLNTQCAIVPLPWEAARDPVLAARACDWHCYLPEDIFTKVDRAAMLHALEVRSPFVDTTLLTFAAALTVPQLLKGGGKRMMRLAFANDLPAWVFRRRKMGFALPIGQWFRNELRPMLRETLLAHDSFAAGHLNQVMIERLLNEHDARRADHAQRLYALLMLELWWRAV